MPAATAAARERARVRGPLLSVSATAWLLMAVEWIGPGGPMVHPAGRGGLPALVAGWLLMLTAMMTPLLVPAVRHVHERSFARRRTRVTTLFVGAYALVWLVAGIGLSGVAAGLLPREPPLAVGVALTGALVWQLTPLKGRCLNRVHAHPSLPAFGRASDAGVVRFGLVHACWCVGACGPLMLVPLVAGAAAPLAMTAVALWLYAERFEPPGPPRWGLRLPTVAARATWRALASRS